MQLLELLIVKPIDKTYFMCYTIVDERKGGFFYLEV